MKAVILAGGFGTRLAEYTELIPKPMVTIGDKPILIHIMDHYAKFGIKEFIIAAGYKSDAIKKFFLDFSLTNSDFKIDLSSGSSKILNAASSRDWTVSVIDTGLDSMTGGRLLRLKPYLGDETFFLTYGDGVSDVDLTRLLSLHRAESNLVTVTAVRPAARFGELEFEGSRVKSFKEKPQLEQGWINGGFFAVQPNFLDYIADDSSILEKAPLERVASEGLMGAHLHHGFWQCMDSKRDRDYLQDLWQTGAAPWQ